MMFCCVTPHYQKLKEHTDIIVISPTYVQQPSQTYLPRYSEHKIQLEPQNFLDDPSAIFYDPDEKPGFVYRSIDREDSFIYEPFEQSTPSVTPKRNKVGIVGNERTDSPLTSEFDDSLDELPHLDSMNEASFDDLGLDTKLSSAQVERLDSVKISEDYSTLRIDDSTENLTSGTQKLNDSNLAFLEDDVSTHLTTMRFYEDSGYSSGGHRSMNKRDHYHSDAESSKTYQDSGIYEDDVFIDSPRHPIDLKVRNDFEDTNHFGFVDRITEPPERLTAFKTPNSSRQNSEESDLSYSPIKPSVNVEKDRPNTSSLSGTKHATKYNHVQPKVQTKRICGQTGTNTSRQNTAHCKGGKNRSGEIRKNDNARSSGDKRKTGEKSHVKAKVGSLENIRHVPGGGDTKIFRQKLNFRSRAEPRTDTHGIEMFSHLPEEFQEIARRLARQDREIKGNERRGRVRSRSTSTVASSRTSSVSPARGRSQSRKKSASSRRETFSSPVSNMNVSDEVSQLTSPTKQSENLSRSSSIRSIPSTPSLSRHHPATASTLYDKKSRSKSSPAASRSQSPVCHKPKPGSRTTSPVLTRSRSRSKSRSRPGTPRGVDSRAASPISQLYHYAQSDFIPPSPRIQGASSVFHFVPVR